MRNKYALLSLFNFFPTSKPTIVLLSNSDLLVEDIKPLIADEIRPALVIVFQPFPV